MAQWTAYRLGALVAFVAVLAGCGPERNLASNKELSGGLWSISVTSPAFRDGEPIPKKYTKDGENISPPLKRSSGPSGTTGYIVIVEDPDAVKKVPALHWLVYRIPCGTNELPENASASGNLVQGKNY